MSPRDRIADWLGRFVGSDQFTEIRGLPLDETKPAFVGFFDRNNLEVAADCALGLQRECKGVYFIPNPVRPNPKMDSALNRMGVAQGRVQATTDGEILRRDWILVDVDPVRPAGQASTEAERVAAWQVTLSVYANLADGGLSSPLIGFSGNGFHLCYPVNLPNNDEARDLCREFLARLDSRCGNEWARIDKKTYNASRIWKLYGTVSQKGTHTPERPHRQSYLCDYDQSGLVTLKPGEFEKAAEANTRGLGPLLDLWRSQERARLTIETGPIESDKVRRAEAYLGKVAPAVSGSGGHTATFHVAKVLMEGFLLTEGEALQAVQRWNQSCSPPWSEKELLHKFRDASKNMREPGWILQQEGEAPTQSKPVEEPNEDEPDATAEDVFTHNMATRWAWKGWIQIGAVTCLAAEPGKGKTRLLMDLAKRIYHGLDWPDGSPPTFERGAKTLWVAADGQWAEMSDLPTEYGIPRDSVLLNAKKSNPFLGTDLDTAEAMKDLEARINRTKPSMVIIDTVGNSTSLSMGKPEDAKKIFKPYAALAQRAGVSVILVTHLSQSGEALGRRIVGAVRQVIMLTEPEGCEQHRRRLWVEKTSSLKPPALGITMGTGGNTYDDEPPSGSTGGDSGPTGDPNTRLPAAMTWLALYLQTGPKPLRALYNEARREGFNSNLIDRARANIQITSTEDSAGVTWWRAFN